MKKSKITTATEPKLPMEGGRRFITNTANPAVSGYYARLVDESIKGVKAHLDLLESHYIGLPAATRGNSQQRMLEMGYVGLYKPTDEDTPEINWDKLINLAKQYKDEGHR